MPTATLILLMIGFMTTWPIWPQAPSRETILLEVDATDTSRGILAIHETLAVHPGKVNLRFAKWIPGNHSASGPLVNVAGLRFNVGRRSLPWVRDQVDPYLFSTTIPPREGTLEISFVYLSPLEQSRGRVHITPSIVEIEWNTCLLFPTSHLEHMMVRPRVRLPDGWEFASALEPERVVGDEQGFAPVHLQKLIDSPLLAAEHVFRSNLSSDVEHPVKIDLATDTSGVKPTAEWLAKQRTMISEVKTVFGQPPFHHYDFLTTASDMIGSIGLEHQQSSEIGLSASYFPDTRDSVVARTLFAHEFIHAWNGKYVYPVGETLDFSSPMRNDLLWLYEGLTEYYAVVLSARSGIISDAEARDVFGKRAADLTRAAGRTWRALADTTNDEIISPAHHTTDWPSYSLTLTNFYYEGSLIWLDVDVLIRHLTKDQRSLDDFSRAFFRVSSPDVRRSYNIADVVEALNKVAPYDWAAFFQIHVTKKFSQPPVEGLEGAGWKIIYTDEPSACASVEQGAADLRNSIGIVIAKNGQIRTVEWGSVGFVAGLLPGGVILSVSDKPYEPDAVEEALRDSAQSKKPIILTIAQRGRTGRYSVNYSGGIRVPHVVRRANQSDLLRDILSTHARVDQ